MRRFKPVWLVVVLAAVLAGCSGSDSDDLASCEDAGNTIAAIDPLIKGEMAAFRTLDEPRVLPGLSFNNADGDPTTLEAFRGKTVLLNIWATWCAPCRHEMPAFDAMQAELGGENFEIAPVSVDRGEPSKPLGFYDEIGLENLGFFHDPTMEIFNGLKRESLAFGLPVTILLDKSGCALAAINGPADWAHAEAKALVEKAIEVQAE